MGEGIIYFWDNLVQVVQDWWSVSPFLISLVVTALLAAGIFSLRRN